MGSRGGIDEKSSVSRASALAAVGTRQGDFVAACSPLAIAQKNERKTNRS